MSLGLIPLGHVPPPRSSTGSLSKEPNSVDQAQTLSPGEGNRQKLSVLGNKGPQLNIQIDYREQVLTSNFPLVIRLPNPLLDKQTKKQMSYLKGHFDRVYTQYSINN